MLRITLRAAVAMLAFLSGASAAGVWDALRASRVHADYVAPSAAREFTPASCSADEAAEREIRDIIGRYAVAQTEHDAAFFRSVEADSFTLTDDDRTITREQDIADMLTWAKDARYESYDVRVQVYGNSAVATGVMKVIPLAEGDDDSSSWHWLHLFVRCDGRWQIISTVQFE
jgi:Domain of unknown function (DUF4440)